MDTPIDRASTCGPTDTDGAVRAGEGYRAAATAVTALVGRIPDAAWDDPALGAWDVRALVGHTSRALSTVISYLALPAESEAIPAPEAYYALAARLPQDRAGVDERARHAGAELGDDPAAAFAALAQRALASVATADPDSVITTIGGGMRVAAYLPTRTFELVVHGYDIADAIGCTLEFPTAVVADASALASRIATAVGHGPTVLRAMTGRIALPAPFSVVP